MFDLAGFLRLPQVVVLDDDTFIFELWVIATDSSSLCSKQQLNLGLILACNAIIKLLALLRFELLLLQPRLFLSRYLMLE